MTKKSDIYCDQSKLKEAWIEWHNDMIANAKNQKNGNKLKLKEALKNIINANNNTDKQLSLNFCFNKDKLSCSELNAILSKIKNEKLAQEDYNKLYNIFFADQVKTINPEESFYVTSEWDVNNVFINWILDENQESYEPNH